jgi:hypothetical protein
MMRVVLWRKDPLSFASDSIWIPPRFTKIVRDRLVSVIDRLTGIAAPSTIQFGFLSGRLTSFETLILKSITRALPTFLSKFVTSIYNHGQRQAPNPFWELLTIVD